jgi:Na+-translocating ferredoxin:NAD+ oxidoreductase RnfE subunit
MTSPIEKLARKIGRIDALIFFVVWASVGMLSATSVYGALPLIIMVLVPASALVGWRGAASAREIIAGRPSVKHAAIEGFGWGVAVAFVVWLWGFSNAALAAGTVFDGLSPLEPRFWLTVATSLNPVLFISACFGVVTGVMLHFINLWLLRTCTAEPIH